MTFNLCSVFVLAFCLTYGSSQFLMDEQQNRFRSMFRPPAYAFPSMGNQRQAPWGNNGNSPFGNNMQNRQRTPRTCSAKGGRCLSLPTMCPSLEACRPVLNIPKRSKRSIFGNSDQQQPLISLSNNQWQNRWNQNRNQGQYARQWNNDNGNHYWHNNWQNDRGNQAWNQRSSSFNVNSGTPGLGNLNGLFSNWLNILKPQQNNDNQQDNGQKTTTKAPPKKKSSSGSNPFVAETGCMKPDSDDESCGSRQFCCLKMVNHQPPTTKLPRNRQSRSPSTRKPRSPRPGTRKPQNPSPSSNATWTSVNSTERAPQSNEERMKEFKERRVDLVQLLQSLASDSSLPKNQFASVLSSLLKQN